MQTIEDVEGSLIGAILSSPEKMATAVSSGVTADWFEADRWSLMWSALERFWKDGEIEGASPVAVRSEAKRLATLPKESRSADALTVDAVERAINDSAMMLDVTIHLLRNAAIERALKAAVAEGLKGYDEYADGTEAVQTLRGKLDGILDRNLQSKKIQPRAVFDTILAEYKEAHERRVVGKDLHWTPGVKMPWPKLTETMNGLRPGLHVIAARPSVGKTSFAVNLMRFWCESGVRVLFCSLDMPRNEVMRRFIAEKSRVSVRKADFSPTQADMESMERAAAEMSGWPLEIVETRDVDALRVRCMVEKQSNRLGVVVVDYLQLLHARALGREDAVEYARISYVSDTLKRLANELQVPVVALAQLNREVTKKDSQGRLPGLADLRGSGSIEQDAFTVTILHRDDAVVAKWASGVGVEMAKRLIPGTLENPGYRYNFDDLDPVWWILCKAQNGSTGKLPFVVRKKYFCWMLGDYTAEVIKSQTGYGATAREVADNSPKFEKVHSDWRHDELEKTLRLQLALIEGSDDVQFAED